MEATKANESIKGAAFIVNETAAEDVFTLKILAKSKS